MKVIEPGHIYELDSFGSQEPQRIVFLKRSGGAVQYSDEHPGTNTQELIRVIIDLIKIVINRTLYLDNIIEAVENKDLLTWARMMLMCYEGRAYRRKQDKLNRQAGEHQSFKERDRDLPFNEEGFIGESPIGIENLPVGEDGHIQLDGEV